MSRTSILNRSSKATAAIFVALLSQAHAADQQYAAAVFPDVSSSTVPDRRQIVLTSRLPWPAPVGHRQPRLVDVPRHESVAGWEDQQRQADEELDRKLVICKGC